MICEIIPDDKPGSIPTVSDAIERAVGDLNNHVGEGTYQHVYPAEGGERLVVTVDAHGITVHSSTTGTGTGR